MNIKDNSKLNYEEPLEIAEGIYWVGFVDRENSLHCNPYLIIEGEEAVLIDGGSRPEFSTVMMKVLQTGINPSSIVRLIYQHYDPDLCGSIPNLEEIIGNKELKIISQTENNVFIKHYGVKSPLLSINSMNKEFIFKTGRKLLFYNTPYSHSAGSFITFDEKTGTLFTSDILGSYDMDWELFLNISEDCRACNDYNQCPTGTKNCPIRGILLFHKKIMTSTKALRYSLNIIKSIPAKHVVPQHGSVIHNKEDILFLIEKLEECTEIGIDGYTKEA